MHRYIFRDDGRITILTNCINFVYLDEVFLTNICSYFLKQGIITLFCSNAVNESGEIKPRSLRFTWSMKTTSSRDPNEIMSEIKKVNN